jgi:hypothetical protein
MQLYTEEEVKQMINVYKVKLEADDAEIAYYKSIFALAIRTLPKSEFTARVVQIRDNPWVLQTEYNADSGFTYRVKNKEQILIEKGERTE